MKKCSVLVVLAIAGVIGLTDSSQAGDYRNNIEGVWEFFYEIDGQIHSLNLTSTSEGFTGEYLNTDNDSVFPGNLYYARGETVLTFLQIDQDYYGVFSGKMVSATKIVGTSTSTGGAMERKGFCLIKEGSGETCNFTSTEECEKCEYSEDDVTNAKQDAYNEGFEAGKATCETGECPSCPDTQDCEASFDMFTNTLHIPNFQNIYWLDFGLNSWEPVTFQLKDMGEIGTK